ncbi:TonB-dependent siderophore receptor (plasmid) [Tistrella mobilis]|uniref:TonB-dependent siderophore receptor n=1 Tax=Tistrella mobilis TaxID=171437 RepID=UPI0035585A35
MKRSGAATGRKRLAGYRRAVLGATALVLSAAALSGHMPRAAAGEAAQGQDLPTRRFVIPAQPLDAALAAFGAASGVQLVYDAGITAGRRSQAVEGTMRADQALARLLAGTGLDYRFSGAGAATILAGGTRGGGISLAPLIVQDGRLASATAPVSGYVATTTASGTKTTTPLIETAQSVSVITADQIADQKVQTVEDALAYTAGVQVAGWGMDPRFDQMQIRGFSATESGDYLDGLKQPNTGWLSYYRTEPYNLERLEVLKGPASVLYGQGEVGGLVNRTSKRPTGDRIREVEVQTGDPDRLQAQFDLGDRLVPDGSLSYRMVTVTRDSEKTIEQIDDDRILLAPSLRWQGELTDVTLYAQYQHDRTGGSPRPYQYPDGRLSHIWGGDENFDKLEQTQILTGYTVSHDLTDRVTLRQNLRYGHVDTDNQYLSGAGLEADGRTLKRTAIGVYETMQSLGVDNQAEIHADTGPVGHTLLIGIDYQWSDGTIDYMSGDAPSLDLLDPDYDQGIARPSKPLALSAVRSNQTGVYIQDQLALDAWRMTLALRHDQATGRTRDRSSGVVTRMEDEATTGRVGLLYLFESGFAPYVSYSTSFKPESGTDISGNQLQPTEGEQYELGVKYQAPGTKSFYTASLYDLTKTNVVTYENGNYLLPRQIGEVRSRGLELEAVAELTAGLKLRGAYSYQEMEITRSLQGDEGNRPTGVPEHLASAWLDYTHQTGSFAGLGGGVGLRYVGETYTDTTNTITNDAYTLMDAALHYDLGGARLQLNARNLADRDVVICQDGYCYRGEGRTVIASLRYRW